MQRRKHLGNVVAERADEVDDRREMRGRHAAQRHVDAQFGLPQIADRTLEVDTTAALEARSYGRTWSGPSTRRCR